jgi:PAS domain S-box-containing protein
MSLRATILASIGITFLIVILLLYGVSQTVVMGSFTRLEQADARESMQNALNAFDNDLADLGTIVNDWASWDDTYAFVGDHNEQYVGSNLVNETFTVLRTTSIVILDTSGEIVYGRCVDPSTGDEVALPGELLAELRPGQPLVDHTTNPDGAEGLISVGNGFLMVAARPILQSNGEGPVRGTLLMGRYLDTSEIEALSARTHVPLTLHRVADPIPDDSMPDDPIAVVPQNETTLAGYAQLTDLHGDPVAVMEAALPRDIYQEGLAGLRYMVIALILTVVCGTFVAMGVLEKTIFSRMAHYTAALKEIPRTSDLSRRMPVVGDDELAYLGRAINDMLSAITTSEGTLKEERDRAQKYLDVAGVIIIVVDIEGRVRLINRRGCEILGYPAEEILGREWAADFVPSRVREDVERAFQALLAGDLPGFEYGENPVLTRVGEERHIEWYNTLLCDSSGTVIGTLSSGVDATERKRVEEEIRSKNKQLFIINQIIGTTTSIASLSDLLETALEKTLDLLEFAGGAIYVADPDQERALLKACHGLPDEFVRGAATLDITMPPYREVCIDGRPRYAYQDELVPAAREFGIFSLASIPLTSGERIVGVLQVASRRRHIFTDAEKEILEAIGKEIGGAVVKAMLQDELETAWRETRLYLDIIAHDIHNANTISLGYLELLAETPDETTRIFADRALTGIHKSMEIVRNVSTIRKIYHEPLQQYPIDLDTIVGSEIARFPEARIRYDGCGCTVIADQLVSEIFTNLIGNAVKFGGPDVEVTVRVEEASTSVVVTVEDTGPGIPDALKAKLFNRFQRGETIKNGKGLGLYISRLLAERYGGSIRVQDRVPGQHDQGCAMIVTLRKYRKEGPESAAR